MSNAAIESDEVRRRAAPGALRRDDDDVHLPGGLHRRSARGHRAGRRRRHARCGSSARPGSSTSPPSGSRWPSSRCATSPTTSTSPTRATRWTSSRSPTSPSAPWRTSGCVTFRETLLLADPEHATQGELQNVVDVIAHELAHMWFGDLVTMKWWNGIWLNEAFATFMELKVTDAFRPEWERWVSFGLARSTAFDTDALQTTRPIEYPVVSPADAEGMFDVLTYEKGAAVVRMLEQYLGEEEFRAGIRKYMANHQYGNTETTDLWDAIEEATGEPVRRIMDSWIFQGGHPIVSVDVARGRPPAALQPGAVPVPARRARRHPLGDPAAAPLRARVGRGRRAPPRCSTATRSTSTSPSRCGGWSPTPTATASTACARRRRCARRWWPRPRPCSPTSSATGSSTTPGRRCSPAPRASTTSSPSPTASPARPTCRCGGACSPGSTRSTGWSTATAREALQARVRALVGPALERLGWDERPDDADRDRELRGALIGALANLGADPDARGTGARALRALLRRLHQRRGQRGRRRGAGHRRHRRRRRDRHDHRALPARRHAAGGAPVPLRPGRGPRPGADGAGARAGHDARRPHAERPVPDRRRASPTATTAPWPGSSCTSAGTR